MRLVVDGDRIVEADAPGLARPLAGLTLLEAAAVPGDTLAVDALANALGPVFRAEPRAGRTAVAMSGGVDSAVALLRALPDAVGVTLRLWLDPDGPSAERACCSPDAVLAARATCHRLGVPHVTLDLREEFRARRRRTVRARLRRRPDAEPVHGLQRRVSLPRAARLHDACGLRPVGDRPLRAHRRARRPHASRARRRLRPRTSRTCSRSSIRPARPRLVPARRPGQGGDARRGGARRPRRSRSGPRARRRASSPATTTARSSPAAASTPRPGAIVDADGRELGVHTGSWRFTPGQRRGIGVVAERPLYVIDTDAAANAVVVGPHEALARRRVRATGRLYAPVSRGRGEAPVPLAGRRGAGLRDGRRLRARARRARVRGRPRAGGRSLRRRRRRRLRHGERRRRIARIAAECSSPHSRGGISGDSRSQSSSSPSALPPRTSSSAWAEPLGASPRS